MSERPELTLGQLADLACAHLPPEWKIELSIRYGEASISLYDPDDEYIDVCTDDMTTEEAFIELVNHARRCAGWETREP